MSGSLVTLIALLGGLIGFAVGWVAKRDFARAYVEANTRYWQARVAELEMALEHVPSREPAAATTVVQHFHMTAPPSWPARVIDAEVVRALPGEVA